MIHYKSHKQENSWSNTEETGRIRCRISKQGAKVITGRKNKFEMKYEIMEKFRFVVHLTGTSSLYGLTWTDLTTTQDKYRNCCASNFFTLGSIHNTCIQGGNYSLDHVNVWVFLHEIFHMYYQILFAFLMSVELKFSDCQNATIFLSVSAAPTFYFVLVFKHE